jgi:hypothetical protein
MLVGCHAVHAVCCVPGGASMELLDGVDAHYLPVSVHAFWLWTQHPHPRPHPTHTRASTAADTRVHPLLLPPPPELVGGAHGLPVDSATELLIHGLSMAAVHGDELELHYDSLQVCGFFLRGPARE